MIENLLLISSIVLSFLAVKALLPSKSASKPNIIGYKSLCSFTPVSSLLLFWAATVLLIVHFGSKSPSGIDGVKIWVIAVSIVFFTANLVFFVRYWKRKRLEKKNS